GSGAEIRLRLTRNLSPATSCPKRRGGRGKMLLVVAPGPRGYSVLQLAIRGCPVTPGGLPMPAAETAGLVDNLRDAGVLTPAQAAELAGTSLDAPVLSADLLRRGWVTRFQAGMIADGRAAELTLGPYVLLDRLGAGGMGEVFRARH